MSPVALLARFGRIPVAARNTVQAVWGCLAGSLLLAACATTADKAATLVGPVSVSTPMPVTSVAAAAPGELTVMTLNIAHARGDGFHQLFQRTDTTIDNLNAIRDLLSQQAPDVVALQEADGPSFWSGNFDHVAYLAETSAFTHHVRAENVRAPQLSYGTALLSGSELSEALAVNFQPGLSPLSKGFVVSTIRWPGAPQLQIDVVSLHLDPFNASLRRQQAAELVDTLRLRGRPVILMGDFNTDWQAEDSVLRRTAEALSLRTFQPHNAQLQTFPALGKRLDWILISEHFEFLSHAILPHPLSDHRGVMARIRLATPVPRPL